MSNFSMTKEMTNDEGRGLFLGVGIWALDISFVLGPWDLVILLGSGSTRRWVLLAWGL